MALVPWTVLAQGAPPSLRAGAVTAHITIDGRLTEPAWQSAEAIDDLRQTDPIEGAAATARTRVQVLADSRSLIIGIVCDEPDPSDIVSFSVRRDAVLTAEDHVRIVLGPFADGRSGYVFAVNPTGARYDGLINPGGESDNPDWDGIWEAATARLPTGWSAEIRIPVLTLAFKPGLREWHFNVQRRIQRRLETDRWASPVASVRGHADQPGGIAHGSARLRSRCRLERPAGGDRRRRHSRPHRRTPKAAFTRASTSPSASDPTCSRRRRSTPTSRRRKSTRAGRT